MNPPSPFFTHTLPTSGLDDQLAMRHAGEPILIRGAEAAVGLRTVVGDRRGCPWSDMDRNTRNATSRGGRAVESQSPGESAGAGQVIALAGSARTCTALRRPVRPARSGWARRAFARRELVRALWKARRARRLGCEMLKACGVRSACPRYELPSRQHHADRLGPLGRWRSDCSIRDAQARR